MIGHILILMIKRIFISFIWLKLGLSLDSGDRLCEILDSGGKTQCGFCFKFIHPSSFKRHVKNQHGTTDTSQVLCDVCNKLYKNEATMKEHKRITHNIYQRINFE